MTQPRHPADPPRRARGIDKTNLCLLIAAALAMLPWLFAPDSSGSPAPRPAATVATHNGVTT